MFCSNLVSDDIFIWIWISNEIITITYKVQSVTSLSYMAPYFLKDAKPKMFTYLPL